LGHLRVVLQKQINESKNIVYEECNVAHINKPLKKNN